MIRHDIDRLIDRCIEDLKDLKEQLEGLKQIDPMEQFEEYKEMTLAASMKAEAATIKTRGLVVESTFYSKQEYYKRIAKTQGITITSEHGWIKIVMPFLLPSKRSKKYNCDLLIDPLDYALRAFAKEFPVKKYEDCILAFRHIYTKEFPDRAIRDHDNIEIKKVIDVITSHLMVDDSGRFCSHFYTSAVGEKEVTEVYVMNKNGLKYWLDDLNLSNVNA